MSLVAYGSSDESDSEAAGESRSARGLFSVLPAPKTPEGTDVGSQETKTNVWTGDIVSNDHRDPQPAKGLFSALPKPKKRTEPVKITIPQIQRQDSDSDEDEPAKKKLQHRGSGSSLSALLPQPKHLRVKETERPLIPHALTKRQDPKGPKPGMAAQGLLGSSASPSAIKAAAKSATLQLAKQISSDDQEKEEEMTPQNYFSLDESSKPLPDVIPNIEPQPAAPADPFIFIAPNEPGQSDAPLDFGGNHDKGAAWGSQYPHYQEPIAGPEALPQGYYNEPYYQEANPGLAEGEEPGQSAVIDEEAFMRLQGKRNRGKEEVKFLEIKGDDQLSGNKQWMTKGMTEEKQTRQSFSKKKGEQPTGQQRRKHQITYLIHQAKERELELKNNWAENKITRRQTQAKYGF